MRKHKKRRECIAWVSCNITVCCFAGQRSASLFSKLCAVIHSRLIVHTWHLSAASWPACCVCLPLFYLHGSWYSPKVGRKDLPLSSCNPSSSSSSSSFPSWVPGVSTVDSSLPSPVNHRLRSGCQTQVGQREVGRTLNTWECAIYQILPLFFF